MRYGGQLVGTLVARCTVGATVDETSVSMLLTTAAAAAAPAMAGVLSRRLTRPADPTSELLGLSQAIEDVRLVIARAAAAPFPVLIEGPIDPQEDQTNRGCPRGRGVQLVRLLDRRADDLPHAPHAS